MWEHAVEYPANDEVKQVQSACEVQAQLRSLNDVPQR